MMEYGHMGFGCGHGFFSFLLLAVLILGIIALVRHLRGKGRLSQSGGESALDILKKRYARGEISKEEFDRVKNDL